MALFPEDGGRLVIGPLIYDIMPDKNITKLLEHCHMPHLYTTIKELYQKLTPVSDAFPNIIQLLADTLYGESNWRILSERSDSSSEFIELSNSRFQIPGRPLESISQIEQRYQYETELAIAVSKANAGQAVEYYEKMKSCTFLSGSDNSLRDCKNFCITLNTLLRKAAEQADVHPIEIDTYSNQNIRRIEELTEHEQCRRFEMKMIYGYCSLIEFFSLSGYSLPIRRAITYIHANLSADLSLHTIAEILCVNSNYLSTLFKKETQLPLTECVNRCRIFQAQQYLNGTSLPIKIIAQRCGISDINYFTRMFRQIIGVTPKAYRMNAPNDMNMQNQKSKTPQGV